MGGETASGSYAGLPATNTILGTAGNGGGVQKKGGDASSDPLSTLLASMPATPTIGDPPAIPNISLGNVPTLDLSGFNLQAPGAVTPVLPTGAPSAPQLQPQALMPTMNSQAVREARAVQAEKARQRKGRTSTFLSSGKTAERPVGQTIASSASEFAKRTLG